MDVTLPVNSPVADNPLLALAAALIRSILYLLRGVRVFIAFVTITLPTYVVRILGYSLTLQLDFTKLLILFGLSGAAVAIWIRYRLLNKYSDLKEPPLAPPDPHLLNPNLSLPADYARSTAFHNYLDEFLAAIRIFGFLEKPVFHELSRHLQTRRLIAGESISLDAEDKEGFICVVDGNVQVFASSTSPSSPTTSSSPFPSSSESTSNSYNGYQLLNEVSTGGTLSSLFTILRLFTEDVKVGVNSQAGDQTPNGGQGMRSDDGLGMSGMGGSGLSTGGSTGQNTPAASLSRVTSRSKLHRVDSEISDLEIETTTSDSDTTEVIDHQPDEGQNSEPQTVLPTQTQFSAIHATSPMGISASMPGTTTASPNMKANEYASTGEGLSSTASAFSEATQTSRSGINPNPLPNQSSTRKQNKPQPFRQQQQDRDRPQVIARATVDTTLAVIPCDAFVRLRHKFPKATGQIVSVILTRFARVTFMTAHEYLGLTKEVLQAEDQLNHLVSHPLPPEFYEQGGMRNLRERFQPELGQPATPTTQNAFERAKPSRQSTTKSPPQASMDDKDYFTFEPTTPGTVKAPSLPSMTPKKATTPVAMETTSKSQKEQNSRPEPTRQDTYQRKSFSRKQVGAGDLLSMTSTKDDGDGYYRPTSRTPGFPRNDTWQAKPARNYTSSISRGRGIKHYEPTANQLHTELGLKEAVMTSIAQSIGLISSGATEIPLSSAADSVNWSTPNSPMPFEQKLPGRPRQSSFGANAERSGFGNLSLLDTARSNASGPGGLLFEEDASNAGTQPESMAGGIEDLDSDVEILYFKAGKVLVKEGEVNAGLFFVIDGFLEVSVKRNLPGTIDAVSGSGRSRDEEILFEVKPGGIAGYLASISSSVSYTTVRAKTDCYIGLLPHRSFERLLERRPIVLLTLAKRLLSVLSPLVHHLDLALDWMQVNAGQNLYKSEEDSNSFYFVIGGRLRSVNESDSGEVKILAEHGQNTVIGEIEAITGSKRSHTVHAIRDSELVRMPMALFNAISVQHPSITIRFLQLIASRVRQASQSIPKPLSQPRTTATSTNFNLKTVCIMPINRQVPVAAFADKLRIALEDIGAPTAYLDQATASRQLGKHSFTRMGKLKTSGWLAEKERRHRMVLYVIDTPVTSSWTMTSIKQADFILLVGMGDDPALGEYEKLLLASGTTARKEMVLLHTERYVPPGSTRRWLRERPFITAHHHVELPGLVLPTRPTPVIHDPAALVAFKHLREKVETRIKKYRFRSTDRPRRLPHLNDFARLARRLCDKSIGLVLGGGGARGISHIGMIQALEELQIPVDAIGGCSIGAFVGGLYAREGDLLSTTGRTKQFAGRMSSLWRILSDITYPYASYTTGHEFNRGIYKAFLNFHLEDMWIPYFCNSTNITHSRMEIHRDGYAWRYVRASMSLAGLLPPLSDDKGNLLLDGGYVSNLPCTEMITELGATDVIAVDVGAVDDTSPRHYGDSVSGWGVLLSRFNPFANRSVLSMTEVSSRLAYVASAATLDQAKKLPGCLYYAMPVQQFETLGGFGKFDEVYKVGLEAAREILKQWKEEGKLPTGLVDDAMAGKAVRRGARLRRMSI